MLTISDELKTHLQEAATTVATLIKITLAWGSTVYYFTDHDVAVTYDGDTYQPIDLANISTIKQSSQLNVDTMEIEIAIDSIFQVTRTEISAGAFNFATVEAFLKDYTDTDDSGGVITVFYGYVGEIELHDYWVKFEVRSLKQLLQQKIGRVYLPICDASYGDSRCGASLSPISGEVEVLSTSQPRKFFFDPTNFGPGNDYSSSTFRYGRIVWTGGNNNGITSDIQNFSVNGGSGGRFYLFSNLPNTIEIGDTFNAYEGCPRTWAACQVRNNEINFRGFPYLPGLDEVLDYSTKA